MAIASGDLDRRITVERAVVTTDDYGGEVRDWTTLCRPWAKINYGRGDERRAAAQESAAVTATFRVRRSARTSDIAPADRIVFDGMVWDITSNVPFERDGRDITAIGTTPAKTEEEA